MCPTRHAKWKEESVYILLEGWKSVGKSVLLYQFIYGMEEDPNCDGCIDDSFIKQCQVDGKGPILVEVLESTGLDTSPEAHKGATICNGLIMVCAADSVDSLNNLTSIINNFRNIRGAKYFSCILVINKQDIGNVVVTKRMAEEFLRAHDLGQGKVMMTCAKRRPMADELFFEMVRLHRKTSVKSMEIIRHILADTSVKSKKQCVTM